MNHSKKTAKRFIISILFCLSLICSTALLSNIVYGEGDEGQGGDTGGVTTSCSSTTNHAYTGLCGDPAGSKGGGASWRIFKTSDASGLDDWTGYSGNILKQSYKSEAITKCADEGWFASFGWDGRYNSHYGYTNFNYQIGPANRNAEEIISGASYNNYNAITNINTLDANVANNTKISDGLALELYKRMHPGASGIPTDVGYFCYSPKVTLTVKHVDTSGNSLTNVTGLGDWSREIQYNSSTTVARGYTDTGYNFKYWRGLNCGNTCTVGPLTSDTTIYAVYEPYSATSNLDIKVKNTSVAAFNNFATDNIYAKPGDNLYYEINYSPNAQGGRNYKPQKIYIEGIGVRESNNTVRTIESLFNSYKPSGLGNWNNGVVASGIYNQTYSYTKDTTKRTEHPEHAVQDSEAGKTLIENADLQYNSGGTTPEKVEIGLDGGRSIGRVYTQLSKNAKVYVPYNFKTSTCILEDNNCNESGNSDQTIYAGEEKQFKFNIVVDKRQNNTLEGDYATVVREAKWKVGISYGDNPNYIWNTPVEGTLNGEFNRNGKTETKSMSINIPDINAGSKICITSATYPKDSYSDLNINTHAYNPDDPNSWSYSTPVCYIIAKKPSVQVWGGNVYSSGKIETATSTKGNLSGYNDYNIDANYSKLSFGSWNELGVISNGQVKGFSSGASLGYGGISNGILSPDPFTTPPTGNTTANAPNPGGSKYSSNCNRSPLTFANDCSGNTTSSIGNSIAVNNAKTDKSALISKYIYGDNADPRYDVNSENLVLNDSSKILNDVYYYHGTVSTLNVPESQININTIQIVHSTGDIFINGNLTYDTGSAYTILSSLPKLVIYAEKNIYIDCNVNRIDAILIAGKNTTDDGNIITCANSNGAVPDVNSPDRAKQLFIYGTIITNQFTPNRTYGAATGANSIVPAEIINFDPSLYLWGGEDSIGSEGRNTNVDVTYSKELAPRY